MAWAQEIKNLVADIKTSHRDRTQYVKDVKGDTAKLMQDIRVQIKDIKGDTADLLAQFDKEMKELAADLKEFLRKSETSRMADFKVMMANVVERVGKIKRRVKRILGEYAAERKEAAGYWAGLSKKASSE
ncbi:MAG: hypothetical protein ABIG90_01480 [bacterium]